MEFDIRNTSEHVQELNTEGIRSPVVSLQYIPKDIQAGFRLLYIDIHTHVATKILLSYQFNLCFVPSFLTVPLMEKFKLNREDTFTYNYYGMHIVWWACLIFKIEFFKYFRHIFYVFRPGGLVVGQLNKISFYEKKQDNQYRLHMLPLEGKDRRKYLRFDIFV